MKIIAYQCGEIGNTKENCEGDEYSVEIPDDYFYIVSEPYRGHFEMDQ